MQKIDLHTYIISILSDVELGFNLPKPELSSDRKEDRQ
jgi:hypothetical protein